MAGCTIGEVEGSVPDWRLSKLGDRGVRRTSKPKEALGRNWAAWATPVSTNGASARQERRGRPLAEPCLVDAHCSYYSRRGLDTGVSDPQTYRSHMQRIPQHPKPERHEGIKMVRPIQRTEKDTTLRQKPKDNSLQGPELPQPCTMKLGRDYALPCTAQCDKELTFEEEVTRKRRVNLEALQNSGRAGDMTTVRGTRGRVEEDWKYAHTAVESPAYLRFAASTGSIGSSGTGHRDRSIDPHSLAAKGREDQDAVRNLDEWNQGTQPQEASAA